MCHKLGPFSNSNYLTIFRTEKILHLYIENVCNGIKNEIANVRVAILYRIIFTYLFCFITYMSIGINTLLSMTNCILETNDILLFECKNIKK